MQRFRIFFCCGGGYCWGIAHAIPHEASADTFNGNPKLEQTVDPEELRPFYDEVPGDHGLFKPCSHNGLQVVSKHMRPRLDFWLYLRFYILGLKGADSRTLLRSRDNPLLRRSWESHTCDPVESAAPEKSVSSSDYAAMEDEARRSLGLSGVFRTSTGEDAVTV